MLVLKNFFYNQSSLKIMDGLSIFIFRECGLMIRTCEEARLEMKLYVFCCNLHVECISEDICICIVERTLKPPFIKVINQRLIVRCLTQYI